VNVENKLNSKFIEKENLEQEMDSYEKDLIQMEGEEEELLQNIDRLETRLGEYK
jgi:chromosome segregation ATPase